MLKSQYVNILNSIQIIKLYIKVFELSYLTGDQLTSSSHPDFYRTAIMNGARLVEMDVYDGDYDRPYITHKYTLTSKIDFEDAIIVCKECAFDLTEYILILIFKLNF